MADLGASASVLPGMIDTSKLPAFLNAADAASDVPAGSAPPTGSEAGAAGGAPASGAESVAGATPPGGQDTLPAGQQTTTAEPFEIAGKSYPSREAAEQDLKSLLGRVPSLQQETEALKKRAAEAENAARAWDEWYRQSGQRQGKAPQEPEKPTEPEKPWFEALDYELIQEIAEEKGIGTALYYALQQMHEGVQKLLGGALDQRFGPIEQSTQAQQNFNTAMGHFHQAADEKNAAGVVLYPELNSEQSAMDIARIWRSIVAEHPDLALSRVAVNEAVMRYRNTNGWPSAAAPAPANPQAPGAASTPAATSGVSEDVLRNAATAAAAAAGGVVTGSGTPRPAAAPGASGASFKDLVGGAPNVRVGKMDFGFEPAHVTG